MNETVLLLLLLATGFICLWKGGDLLVEGAGNVARSCHIPDLLIGLTLVSFGTSAPELVVNVLASLQQKPDIIFGNIIGSNIANTLLILGLSGSLFVLALPQKNRTQELLINILIGAVVIILACLPLQSPALSRWDSVALLIIFVGFLYWLFSHHMLDHRPERANGSLLKPIIWVILGAILLPLGGKWVIDSGTQLAQLWGISEALIALFAIALGTSLPELVTTIIAAKKGASELALGNIIGSNIFNLVLILGVSGLIAPIALSPALMLDFGISLLAVVALFGVLLLSPGRYLSRGGSMLLLLGYGAYLLMIVLRG
ncbi:MAG: sodium:proton exchanger [Actinobacteria bacterium]|nr:sodium:proton exchanger [Actinomycetota bacterium]